MKPHRAGVALALAVAVAALTLNGACSRETPSPAPRASAESERTVASIPSASALASASNPAAALDAMDQRTPVPLLPMMAHHQKQNMRDHLLAVQEIVTALASDDYPGVEKAAARIGYSERMGQMCNHMGAGAPGFSQQALEFHRTADRIGVAARDKDRGKVLSELGATLKTCTTCHAAWKQEVVSDAEWSSRVSVPAHPAH